MKVKIRAWAIVNKKDGSISDFSESLLETRQFARNVQSILRWKEHTKIVPCIIAYEI